MTNWFNGQNYKQQYAIDDNEQISLLGERIEVYAEYLTAEERSVLETMRSNYEDISAKLAKYEAEPQKMEVLESEAYQNLAQVAEFIELKDQKNHFDLSIDELTAKCDEMLLAYAKNNTISFEEESNKANLRKLPLRNKRESRYGNIFKK